MWLFDANNTYLGKITGSPVNLTSTGWTRVTVAGTTPAKTARCYLEINAQGATGDVLWTDGMQIESKAYVTSWTAGGSTRKAETLTLPYQGVWNNNTATVEFDYVPEYPSGAGPTRRTLFQLGNSGNEERIITNGNELTWTKFQSSVLVDNASTVGLSYDAGDLLHIALAHNAVANNDTISVYRNGILIGTGSCSGFIVPTMNTSSIHVGYWMASDGVSTNYFADGLISNLYISNRTKSDAELQANACGDLPPAIDRYTTWFGNFAPYKPEFLVNEDAGAITLTVRRTGSLSPATGVSYITAEDTAVPGTNYVSSSGTLDFGTSVATRTFSVPILDDHAYDPGLLFGVLMSADPNAVAPLCGSATVYIKNTDPQLPTPGAAAVSYVLPATMTAGQVFNASIALQNTGTLGWNESVQVRLGGVGDASGDAAKFGQTRFGIPAGVTVAPGQSWTFNFTMTAPAAAGKYNPAYRMVWENQQWFGDTVSAAVTVNPAPTPTPTPVPVPDAAAVSSTIPTTMTAGQAYTVSVTMRKHGHTTLE